MLPIVIDLKGARREYLHMINTRKMVLLALLVSQALILSIVEAWIPVPVPVPGVKLGLANIVTLIVLMYFSLGSVLAVVSIRCFLSAAFGGGFVVFLFSICGGILSAVVMYFIYRRLSKNFSILGVSIAGAVAHNIGQLAMASIVMRDLAVFNYLPVLLVSGIVMGCFVGLCSSSLSRALEKTGIMTKC